MFEDLLQRLVGGSLPDGATADQVLTTEQSLGRTIPADLVELVRWHDGISGVIEDEPGGGMYFALFPVSEWATMTTAYGFDERLPDTVIIGSNGGGEAIVLDCRQEEPRYALVPFVVAGPEDLLPLGSSVQELLDALARRSAFDRPSPSEASPTDAWEIEFRWKELVIYWEGEKGCQFEAGWGVEPGVTYVPTRERWDQSVPTWMVGRFDEVVARLQSDPGHVLRFEPGPVSGRGVEVTR